MPFRLELSQAGLKRSKFKACPRAQGHERRTGLVEGTNAASFCLIFLAPPPERETLGAAHVGPHAVHLTSPFGREENTGTGRAPLDGDAFVPQKRANPVGFELENGEPVLAAARATLSAVEPCRVVLSHAPGHPVDLCMQIGQLGRAIRTHPLSIHCPRVGRASIPGLGLAPGTVRLGSGAPAWERATAMAGDRAIVGVLLVVMFTSGADLLVMTPILPQVASDLGVGADLAGLWFTAYAVATGVFALAFGPVSDHVGRRAVLRGGMLVLVVGTVACAFATSFEGMLAARFLAGAGAGLLVTSTTSYAGDHFPTERRAVVVGWVMSGFFLSLILAVPVGALISGKLGWRPMFLVLTAFAGAVALALFTLPVPRFEKRSRRLSVQSAARAYADLLQNPRVAGILLMSFSIGLAMTMFSVYSSPWMAETFGLSTADRGLVYAFGGPAVLIGGPLAGRLSNHFGRVSLVVAGSALMGLMQLLMPLTASVPTHLSGLVPTQGFASFGDWPWPLLVPVVAVFFVAMAAGATHSGPFQTLALEVAPGHRRGAVAALRNGFNQLGSGLGAALGGLVWSQVDPAYDTICAIAALTTFLGVIGLRWLVGSDRPHLKS